MFTPVQGSYHNFTTKKGVTVKFSIASNLHLSNYHPPPMITNMISMMNDDSPFRGNLFELFLEVPPGKPVYSGNMISKECALCT